ncbi:MAG: hypothetical protein JRG81_00060 [Deltaproteobacteria bacterium]|nr:hypothetical protein [Deltaproteobacteria bacterium]MBW2363470.1 hypothetical protein [Deltaproteobacteria bacterium]
MGNQQVVHALDVLSRTVRGLGRDKSRSDIALKSLGLRGRQQEYDIGRQSVIDDRASEMYEQEKPGRELKSKEDVAASQAYNRQLSSSDLVRSAEGAEFMFYKNKDGTINIDKLATDLNYDVNKDEPGKYKYFHKGTNRPVIHGEAGPEVQAWAIANTSGKRAKRAKIEKLDEALADNQINQAQYNKNIAQIEADSNNPQKLIQQAQTRISSLNPYAATKWGKAGIAKDNARIEKLQTEMRAAALVTKNARIKASISAKDTRSTLQKNAQYMASIVPGLNEEQAMEKLMGDKKAANMVTAFIKAIDGMDPTKKYDPIKNAEETKRLKDVYQIDKFISTSLKPQQKTIVKRGVDENGKEVVQYDDGTYGYAKEQNHESKH